MPFSEYIALRMSTESWSELQEKPIASKRTGKSLQDLLAIHRIEIRFTKTKCNWQFLQHSIASSKDLETDYTSTFELKCTTGLLQLEIFLNK